jgi:hypothetical protein
MLDFFNKLVTDLSGPGSINYKLSYLLVSICFDVVSIETLDLDTGKK